MQADHRTIGEICSKAFNQYADRPAFTCLGKTLSFKEIDDLSAAFACWLQQQPYLSPGDRIAVQLPNVLQYPAVAYGILRAGMVLVNTNPLYTSREIKHQLNDSGAKVLVVLANLAAEAHEVIHETSVQTVVVTEIADLHGFPKAQLMNFAVRYLKRLVPDLRFPSQVSLRQALKQGADQSLAVVDVDAAQVAVLQYTGGTTGVSKGAMLTHRNLVSNLFQTRYSIGDRLRDGCEIYVAPLPLYHVYAFMVHCLMLLESGNHSILIPNPRDLESLVKAIKGVPFTGFCGLNTLFNGLCHYEAFKTLDFSHLRLTTSGGMALTRDVAELWHSVTGCHVVEGYGLTETSPVVAFNPPQAVCIGTVGLPVQDTEVKLVSDQGVTVNPGEAGEILVRGPQVMEGYWNRPEETREAIDAEGWFATGDIAVLTDEGYIKIVDRKKDMILVSGFNVYPNEIEDEVTRHPDILEAAAIGVADEKTGEAIKLFVVRKNPALTEAEVVAYCRENLTGYKVPHHIQFVDDLPKSNVGKVLRKELRDQE